MRQPRLHSTTAALALSISAAASAQTPPYHALLLGIADGRTGIQVEHPTGLNRWGQVIGTYGGGLSGGTHGVLWTPASANDGSSAGTLYPIEQTSGLPPGTTGTTPTGINDRGQIAGTAHTPSGDGNQTQSWLWRPDKLNSGDGSFLNAGTGSAVTFALLDICCGPFAQYNLQLNNGGMIAAYGSYYHALLWTPATKNGLSGTWTHEPNRSSPPSGINDAGQIAGSINQSSENLPYRHSGPFPITDSELITSPLWEQPPSSDTIGYSTGINKSGSLAITGLSSSRQILAYLDRSNAVSDVSTGLSSRTSALNDYGQVVGHVDTDTRRATLFENKRALDLNTLNDATGGLLLRETIAINNAGQILCTGNYPGAGATILLTPAAGWIGPASFAEGAVTSAGGNYTQTITVTNTGSQSMPAPVSIALDSLTSGVKLSNATGKTAYAGPTGHYYIDLSVGSLPPGATSAPVTLVFANAASAAISYRPRLLAGTAPR